MDLLSPCELSAAPTSFLVLTARRAARPAPAGAAHAPAAAVGAMALHARVAQLRLRVTGRTYVLGLGGPVQGVGRVGEGGGQLRPRVLGALRRVQLAEVGGQLGVF